MSSFRIAHAAHSEALRHACTHVTGRDMLSGQVRSDRGFLWIGIEAMTSRQGNS
jgi:hypothetical protein